MTYQTSVLSDMLSNCYRVTAVRLSATGLSIPSFEHITHLRGTFGELSKADLIQRMRNGTSYYTAQDMGPRAYLEIVEGSGYFSTPYVRTKPDCTRANNLLYLPRF